MELILIVLIFIPTIFIISAIFFIAIFNIRGVHYVNLMIILNLIITIILTLRIFILLCFARRKVFKMYKNKVDLKKIKGWISEHITNNGSSLESFEFSFTFIFSFAGIALSMSMFQYGQFSISPKWLNITVVIAISIVLSLLYIFLIHNIIRQLQIHFVNYFRRSTNIVCQKVSRSWSKKPIPSFIKTVNSFLKDFIDNLPFSKSSMEELRRPGFFYVIYHHIVDVETSYEWVSKETTKVIEKTKYYPQETVVSQPKQGFEIYEFSCGYCDAEFKVKVHSYQNYKKITSYWLFSFIIVSVLAVLFKIIGLINNTFLIILLIIVLIGIFIIAQSFFHSSGPCTIYQVSGKTRHKCGTGIKFFK